MRWKFLPVVLIASAAAIAQTPAPANAPSPQATAPRTLQAGPVTADLKSSLDSKKAKQGDPVTAVVNADASLPDGTRLPKGTTLNGCVTEVAAYDKKAGSAVGSVTVVFDEAKTKDGTVTPIVSMVRELKPSPMAQYMASQGGGTPADPSAMAPSSSSAPSGAGSSGAGSSAGAAPAANMPAASMPSAAASSSDVAKKEAAEAPAGAVQTAIPDVVLAPPANASASGTIASSGKNVHVDGGSQLMLAVAVRPQQPAQ